MTNFSKIAASLSKMGLQPFSVHDHTFFSRVLTKEIEADGV